MNEPIPVSDALARWVAARTLVRRTVSRLPLPPHAVSEPPPVEADPEPMEAP